MFAAHLTAEWMAWVAALATPLHHRLAWRLADVTVGILMASGRRTATSWFLAAAIGDRFRSFYYFLDAVGRKAAEIAAVLLRLVLDRIDTGQRLVFALDDTPTNRYGPKVQGAGIHHNPTPGPAGAKFLYGQSWVVLSRIVRQRAFGVVGLPLLGSLYVRQKDLPKLPASAGMGYGNEKANSSSRLWRREADGQWPSLSRIVAIPHSRPYLVFTFTELSAAILASAASWIVTVT
jgi:hypothetical protein